MTHLPTHHRTLPANRRPRQARFPATLILLGALGALFGCGDDSDDRTEFRIELDGVEGDDQVGDLTDSELEAICGEYNAYLRSQISFDELAYVGCLPAAIALSNGDADRCVTLLDDCTDAFPEPIDVDINAGREVTCAENLRRCDEQVLALEGCVNLNLDLFLDILGNWTCGNNAEEQIMEAAALMDSISICTDTCDFGGLPAGPI